MACIMLLLGAYFRSTAISMMTTLACKRSSLVEIATLRLSPSVKQMFFPCIHLSVVVLKVVFEIINAFVFKRKLSGFLEGVSLGSPYNLRRLCLNVSLSYCEQCLVLMKFLETPCSGQTTFR